MKTPRDRAIALAGVGQFALWTQNIAARGEYTDAQLQLAVDSVLRIEPETAEAVFGGVENLQEGLALLDAQFSGSGGDGIKVRRGESEHIGGYVGRLLRLAGRVQHDSSRLNAISSAIQEIEQSRQAGEDPSVWLDSSTQRLAALYQKTVSDLQPRIMVQGHARFLENDQMAARIRALLFAGLRSAVLWRQCGGRLWLLLIWRRRLLQEVQKLREPLH